MTVDELAQRVREHTSTPEFQARLQELTRRAITDIPPEAVEGFRTGLGWAEHDQRLIEDEEDEG